MKILFIISPVSEIPYLVNVSLAGNLLLMSEIFDPRELALSLA
jgi:hypothetical protein